MFNFDIIANVFIVIPISIILFIRDLGNVFFNKEKSVDPKIILITGASSGIGASIAREYAKPGVILGLLARSEDKLSKVAEQCIEKGAKCEILKIDISNIESLNKALEDFDDKYPIDLLFANAGQLAATRDNFGKVKWEDAYKPYIDKENVVKSQLQLQLRDGLAPPTTAFYNSMKSALNTFARDLFYIAKPYNVHISLIVPGLIETNMTAHPDQPFPHTPNRYESADNLAKIIKYQLSYNVFHIGWPYFQNIITFTIATFPIRIQLLISNMMGNHMTKMVKILY
ncbi:unnamed protein product [Rhizophagus irregularis]|nr:unnamed protein product [Rhizophagus irregularis]